ncbi:ufm1-specific protease 2-like [Heterodontus francisci]|uniref:ufm1-specific protease 2-like n=1 Tax=Heterodontus francisci TaxID=7792 RepID=UPI00355C2D1D
MDNQDYDKYKQGRPAQCFGFPTSGNIFSMSAIPFDSTFQSRSLYSSEEQGQQLPLDSEDLLFRIKGGIQLEGVLNESDGEGIKQGFRGAINELIAKVNSQAFILSGLGGSLYMWPKTHSSTHASELQEETQCKAILKFVTVEVNDHLKKIPKKKSVKIVPLKVINLQIMFEVTRPDLAEEVIIQHNNRSRSHFKLTLPVDVVVLAHPEDPWGKLQDQFVEAVSTQLSEMDKCIQRYTDGKSIPIPQPFHFELPEKTTLTTVIYPAGIIDENLQPQRKELHTELGLGDKPLFRRPMAFRFPSDELMDEYVRNVHKYLLPPNPDEFKVFIVHGLYTYNHHLQDGVDDRGWGAPYRCLQIIISWFNYQGYIAKPIPTLPEIQQMLTEIDDDALKSMAPTDWIGVFQFATLLNSLDISSNTMKIQYNLPFLPLFRTVANLQTCQNPLHHELIFSAITFDVAPYQVPSGNLSMLTTNEYKSNFGSELDVDHERSVSLQGLEDANIEEAVQSEGWPARQGVRAESSNSCCLFNAGAATGLHWSRSRGARTGATMSACQRPSEALVPPLVSYGKSLIGSQEKKLHIVEGREGDFDAWETHNHHTFRPGMRHGEVTP